MEKYVSSFMVADFTRCRKLLSVYWKRSYTSAAQLKKDSEALYRLSQKLNYPKLILDLRSFGMDINWPLPAYLTKLLKKINPLDSTPYVALVFSKEISLLFWIIDFVDELIPTACLLLFSDTEDARSFLCKKGRRQRVWFREKLPARSDVKISMEEDPKTGGGSLRLDFSREEKPFVLMSLKYCLELKNFREQNLVNFQEVTEKEYILMKHLSQNSNVEAVARKLCISKSTVKKHKENLRLKLNISNAAELLRYALAFVVR